MFRRLFGILAILGLLSNLAILSSSAAAVGTSGALAAPAASRPSVAIGTIPPAAPRLARPRPDVVEQWLRADGAIAMDASAEAVDAAVDAYYARFAKDRPAWVRPELEQMVVEREKQLGEQAAASGADGANAVQPVSAKVLALAVDFGGPDTFTHYDDTSGTCELVTVTKTGPLKGAIPQPGALDNQTIWYAPAQIASAAFYEKLIFGYEGVGRVRLDLTDPDDGLLGINLGANPPTRPTGYTVQDYYDHIAGPGNVTISGSVQGWVTVDHSEGYYGADNCLNGSHYGGGPVLIGQLVIDSIAEFQQAHPSYYNDTAASAFWKQYDADDDGIIDTFWIIHAGMGQEEGGGAEGNWAIWSHSSDLRYQGWSSGHKVYEGDASTIADDIYVGPYTMQPENMGVGVVSEEFGHNFFGLPDLYTTDAENSVGFWSNMSSGSWGGYLGGATPVGFPLWFKMIAVCGTTYCNWQEPMVTREYNAAAGSVTIGQLEATPNGVNKGVRVNMPPIVLATGNLAGSGKGAYTGKNSDGANLTLDRSVAVPAVGSNILAIDSLWGIEQDFDYGYVLVKDGSNPWEFLADMDGIFVNTNPNGTSLGWGLTGSSASMQTLRFDLSAYAGKTITLRLRYVTDTTVTGDGWWIDNVRLDTTAIDAFESATAPGTFPTWTNSNPGWLVVPLSTSYVNYYLVEWRAPTKYDKALRTAYLTAPTDPSTSDWRVNRIPYNIPAAVLYYRDTRYSSTYAISPNQHDAPSYGPKYQLLVVDMNPLPLRFVDGAGASRYTNSRTSSYDAALTLQGAPQMTVPAISGVTGGPFTFPARTAVTSFDDGVGYYAGLYFGAPCAVGYVCYANTYGSAVIPARANYTLRVTTYDGSPVPQLHGSTVTIGGVSHVLGTGNPKDSDVAWGVKMQLVSKAADNSTAVLSFLFDPEMWSVMIPRVSRQ